MGFLSGFLHYLILENIWLFAATFRIRIVEMRDKIKLQLQIVNKYIVFAYVMECPNLGTIFASWKTKFFSKFVFDGF